MYSILYVHNCHDNFYVVCGVMSQRELHSAAFMGFVRNGCRWGWKLGVFAGIFRYVPSHP